MKSSALFSFFVVAVLIKKFHTIPLRAFRRPMENKRYFEGDIVLRRELEYRSAVPKDKDLWPGGKIYYKIHESLESERDAIQSAMKHIETSTCLKFEENTDVKAYVLILNDVGCYSHVGRDGVPQPLSLGKGCLHFGTIVHELLHTVGFYHEHTRSDRDDYLEIFWENIDPDFEEQFDKLLPSANRLINDFDYSSIMLYGELAFSVDGVSHTMKPKKSNIFLPEVRDKKGLSKNDIIRINTLYRCHGNV